MAPDEPGAPFSLDAAPDPHAERFQRLYRRRFGDRERARKDAIWRVVVEDFFQGWIRPQDCVLDIGCGMGEFLNHLKCARRIGIDLNPDSVSALSEGIEFHAGDVRDLSFLPEGSVDAVFTSNLLEHLPSKGDVERMLGDVRRVLKPGGHLIAMGPNLRFLPGDYWDFWDHHVPITDRSLQEILEELEFAVVDRIPRFLPYTTCSSIPQSPWLVRIYLRFPIFWHVLGRQFLIRARKP